MKVLSRIKIVAEKIEEPSLKAVVSEIRKYLKKYDSIVRSKVIYVDNDNCKCQLKFINNTEYGSHPFVTNSEDETGLEKFLEQLEKQYDYSISFEAGFDVKGFMSENETITITVERNMANRLTRQEEQKVADALAKAWEKEINSPNPIFETEWKLPGGKPVKAKHQYLGGMIVGPGQAFGAYLSSSSPSMLCVAYYVPQLKIICVDRVDESKALYQKSREMAHKIVKNITGKTVRAVPDFKVKCIVADFDIPSECIGYADFTYQDSSDLKFLFKDDFRLKNVVWTGLMDSDDIRRVLSEG